MTYPGSMDPWIHGSMDPWIPGYPKSDISRIRFWTGFGSFESPGSRTPTTHETFYHFLPVWESFFRTGYFGGLARSTTLTDLGCVEMSCVMKHDTWHVTHVMCNMSCTCCAWHVHNMLCTCCAHVVTNKIPNDHKSIDLWSFSILLRLCPMIGSSLLVIGLRCFRVVLAKPGICHYGIGPDAGVELIGT